MFCFADAADKRRKDVLRHHPTHPAHFSYLPKPQNEVRSFDVCNDIPDLLGNHGSKATSLQLPNLVWRNVATKDNQEGIEPEEESILRSRKKVDFPAPRQYRHLPTQSPIAQGEIRTSAWHSLAHLWAGNQQQRRLASRTTKLTEKN